MLKNIRSLAMASFVEGLITFAWLASIPASGGNFSPVRLASLLGILLVSFGCFAVFVYNKSENKFTKKIEGLANGRAGIFLTFLLTAVSFTVLASILYRDKLLSMVDAAVYARLLPMAIFGALFSLQLGILFLTANIEKGAWTNLLSPVWKPTLLLLGCFLAIWILIAITHLGFIFDNVGLSWGPPGTPITFAQVGLVFMVSVLLAFAYSILKSKIHLPWLSVRDIVIFLGLWGLAVFLWWNQPVSTTHFNPPPMAPNYETYPNSDAMIFDRSSYHLLFGTGFSNQLARRPLYVGMLALFHKIGGFGYENTIFLQILFLAFIPSLTYLITSKLSNRLAGIIAGGLILLREKNAIELSDKIVTSNAKLMMSDMVAMLGVITFLYVMVKALTRKDNNIWLLGIAGACLGLTALVRAQVFILIPPLLLFIFLERRPLKINIKEAVFIILGLVMVMSPWVWRNWNLTGTFVLDDRGEEKLLARNYSLNPIAFPPLLLGETEKEYSARIKRGVFTFMFEHPSEVTFFVSNHFFRNLVDSAVYIAPAYSTDSPQSLVSKTPFWDEWDGALTNNSWSSLFTSLILVAFGVGIAQAKDSRAGWFPFVSFLFYSGGNALVRSSGWRFSMPADWIIIVYFSIALAYLPSRIKFISDGKEHFITKRENKNVTRKYTFEAIVFCLLLLAGASVPMAERLIPARNVSNFTRDAKEILLAQNVVTNSEIDIFLKQENAVFYSGVALYPRYIPLKNRIYLAYAPSGYPFLHFWLINDSDRQIVLPLQNSPTSLPHTAIISIIGCQENNYIATWAVIEHSPEKKIIIREPRSPLSCPLPKPIQN